MKYVFIVVAIGIFISYHLTNVNHSCESSQIMGRSLVRDCSKNEALNIPTEQQTVFGRVIVK